MRIEELLPDTGRRTAEFAAVFVMEHPEYLQEIVNHSFSDNHKMAMRASRVLNLLQEKEPEIITPLLSDILPLMKDLRDPSAKRNLTKLYIGNVVLLNENEQLLLMDLCFGYLKDLNTETGTKAYSLEILFELAGKIPEIQSELLAVIELQYDTAKTAVKCKADKIRKAYKKQKIQS